MESSSIKPVLLGCAGTKLTDEEASFFASANPFGFILFARNVQTPEQVRALTASLRRAVGREDAPVFVDQEGGRVARLRPPHWPSQPAAGDIGNLYAQDKKAGREAMRVQAETTARFLREVGIDGNCAPVLDLSVSGASPIMGDRTLSADPEAVAELGRIAVQTYLANGVMPVIKHMPGHGRVKVDPHEVLPFVDTEAQILEAWDFVPFRLLNDAPIGMNCHVVFRELDPQNPVSLSRRVHDKILRGKIGFKGLIFSDDLAMKALDLPLAERGKRALEAGADVVLYCPGVLEDSRAFCEPLPDMGGKALRKWAEACGRRKG